MVEGEQKGGEWTAPAEGPAKGWGAEAVYPRHRERMAGVARGEPARSSPWASPPACRATKFSRRPQGRGVGVDRGALRWPWGGG